MTTDAERPTTPSDARGRRDRRPRARPAPSRSPASPPPSWSRSTSPSTSSSTCRAEPSSERRERCRRARLACRRRRSRAPLGDRRRRHHRAAGGDDGVHRAALGGDAAVARRDHRPAHAARLGRVRREQPRHRRSAPTARSSVRLIAQQYSFEPQCIVVPADMPVTFRGTSTDVDPRLRRRHDQRQRDAGAGLRRHVHDHVPARPASS